MNTRTSSKVGTLEWEWQGGPALSTSQRAELLLGYGTILSQNLAIRGWLLLQRAFGLELRRARLVDFRSCTAPDGTASRQAEEFLRDVSSIAMVNHCYRTYCFASLLCQLAEPKPLLDVEALYVASLLHDVGLFQSGKPLNEHCFSVGSAQEARRIAKTAGWDQSRIDNVAISIMTNLNPWVSTKEFGAEAHFMRVGGTVEVLAQYWKIHPENAKEVLALYPRDDFAADSISHVRMEADRNPGSRFGCLCSLYSFFVPKLRFVLE